MDTLIKNCSAAILAGGENKRMPVLKSFIEVEGEKIIERNLKIMKPLFREIFIVTNQPEAYSYLGVPMLGDTYNVRGPMTGVFTSLLNSSNRWVFISACDMPYINAQLITYMASKRRNFDAVIPKSPIPPNSPLTKRGHRGVKGDIKANYTEPLFAFYSKRLLASMEKTILNSKGRIKDFLNNKRVQYIKTREIKKIDPEARSFINLNTPEDIDFYFQPEDKMKFKKKAERR